MLCWTPRYGGIGKFNGSFHSCERSSPTTDDGAKGDEKNVGEVVLAGPLNAGILKLSQN